MAGRSEIEKFVTPILESEGFRLFDMDLPSSGGALRIYAWRGKGEENITVGDCVSLTAKIRGHKDFIDLFSEEGRVEVSSPGLDRRLRAREHFEEAVGECLRVTGSVESEGKENTSAVKTITGVLESFQEDMLQLKENETDKIVLIPFAGVKKAKVQFV